MGVVMKQDKRVLRYLGYSVVFAEVPDEVSLVINISGCPFRCKGCHSSHLQEYTGRVLLDDIDKMINEYDGLITCVCFMGGDWNRDELTRIVEKVKAGYGLKVCLYSGDDDIGDLVDVFDFVKVGQYDEVKGGLNCEGTNQRFYRVDEYGLVDMTHRFRHG